MRFRELHLDAVGPFTNRTLPFAGGAALHLVHGPNEAGKSSALRALTSFLYGFPGQTTDDFLHDYKALRVGATIDGPGGTLRLARRKGNKNTLLDASGAAADGALDGLLSGVAPEMFAAMFGLTLEQLRIGGDALLRGHGDVGQALFGAGAGLGRLREVMDALDKEGAALFKERATKDAVNGALREFREKRKEMKEKSVRPKDWDDAERERADAERALAELRVRLDGLRSAHATKTRLHHALVPFANYRAAVSRLDALAAAGRPNPLRDAFAGERVAAQSGLTAARVRIEQAESELERIAANAAELGADERLLAYATALSELRDDAVKIRSAITDRAKLAEALERETAVAERMLAEFRPGVTLSEADGIRLTDHARKGVQDLIAEAKATRQAHDRAERTAAELTDERARLSSAADEGGDGAERLMRLLEQVRVRRGDADALLKAESAEALAKQAYEESLKALRFWTDGGDGLAACPLPSQTTVAAYRERFDDLAAVRRENAARRKECGERRAWIVDDLAALDRGGALPTEASLAAARGERDDAWRTIRAAWEGGRPPASVGSDAADGYERMVSTADEQADTLRIEAERVAKAAQLREELVRLDAAVAALDADEAGIAARESALTTEWSAEWSALADAPKPPKEMAAWLTDRDGVLALRTAYRDAQAGVETLRGALDGLSANLDAILTDCGEQAPAGEPFAARLSRAEAAVERQREAFVKAQRIRERRADIETRLLPQAQKAAAAAREEWARWQSDWAEAVKALGLEPEASVEAANRALAAHDAFFAEWTEIRRKAERVAEIDRAKADFDGRVGALLDALGEPRPADPAAAVEAMYAGLAAQQKAAERRAQLAADRTRHEDTRNAARIEGSVHEESLKRLCAEAGVESPDDLPEAERRWEEWRRIAAERDGAEEEIARFAGTRDQADFRASLAEEDAGDLETALGRLDEEIVDADARREAAAKRLAQAEAALNAMDHAEGAAEAAAQAAAALAQAGRHAEDFARLAVARGMLAQAVEQYRKRNEGPVLARASGLFAALTEGSFAGVEPRYGADDQPVLMGLRPEGAPVAVEGMSEGTRDQLYFALRLATLEEYLAHHPPLPFILDDVFVSFDDARAIAALNALRGVAAKTQVICFTHHRHLVELAQQVYGGELDLIELDRAGNGA